MALGEEFPGPSNRLRVRVTESVRACSINPDIPSAEKAKSPRFGHLTSQ